MEAEPTKMYSRLDNLSVSEDTSVYESAPIDIRKEQNKNHTKRQ